MWAKLGGSLLATVIVIVLVSSGAFALWADILLIFVLILALAGLWFR